ncbi:MAG: hypothetical protein ACOYKD_02810 [Anaerolineaceae bacterium]|jgi:hypothetical protein
MWRKKIFSMFIGLLLVLTRVPLTAFLGALLAFFLVVSSRVEMLYLNSLFVRN